MNSSDDPSLQEKDISSTSNAVLGSVLYWILFFGSLLPIILGVFSIAGVIIDATQTARVNYFDGLLVGFLLVAGGFILLLGTIIMRNWTPPPFPETDTDSL
ncbi:MAG: hypothetical protein ACW98F_02780 [Candidatus Hodarchaeales archaeon]|jgi:hypothetical protein